MSTRLSDERAVRWDITRYCHFWDIPRESTERWGPSSLMSDTQTDDLYVPYAAGFEALRGFAKQAIHP